MLTTLPDVDVSDNLIAHRGTLRASGLLLVSVAVLNFIITASVDDVVGHLQTRYKTATATSITAPKHVTKPSTRYKEWVYPKIGGGSYTLRVPDSEIRMWGLPVHPVSRQTGTATVMSKRLPTHTMGLPLSDIRMAGFAATRTGAGGGYGGRPYFKPHRPLHLAQPAKHVQPLVVFPALPVPQHKPTTSTLKPQSKAESKGVHIENGYGDMVDLILIVLASIAYLMGAVVSRNIKTIKKLQKGA